MTYNGLTFFDLFSIYRSQGMPIRRALTFAWQYRNFVPDHSGSRALRQHIEQCRQEAEQVYFSKLFDPNSFE